MRKFFILAILIGFLAMGETAIASKPILFGLNWGDTPAQCNQKGMKDTTPGSSGIYLDYKNASRKIGDIKINTVGYSFCHEKLTLIFAFIENELDLQTLNRALNKKYGAPKESSPIHNVYGNTIGINYIWSVGIVTIKLKFNFARGSGHLSYVNNEYIQPCIQDTENKDKSISEDL